MLSVIDQKPLIRGIGKQQMMWYCIAIIMRFECKDNTLFSSLRYQIEHKMYSSPTRFRSCSHSDRNKSNCSSIYKDIVRFYAIKSFICWIQLETDVIHCPTMWVYIYGPKHIFSDINVDIKIPFLQYWIQQATKYHT